MFARLRVIILDAMFQILATRSEQNFLSGEFKTRNRRISTKRDESREDWGTGDDAKEKRRNE